MVDETWNSSEKNTHRPGTLTPEATGSQDDIQAWRGQMVRGILRALMILGFLAVLAASYSEYAEGHIWRVPIYVGAYALVVLVAFWPRTPYTLQAGVVLVLLYGMAILDFFNSGLSGDGGIFLLAFTALAMLFFGRRIGTPAIVLSILSFLAFGWAYSRGQLVIPVEDLVQNNTNLSSWASSAGVFLMLGSLLVVSQNHMFAHLIDSLIQSRSLARELGAERTRLEERIAERTRELEHRARHLQATAEVARSTASTLDVQSLISRVANLVSQQFGFYHTGLFLLDPSGEWAELRAASSEGGRRMLARGHRLRLGTQGIVGYAASRGEPRIALDVGEDVIYFDNPDMPDTRSELALPLRARGEIIGVLDVQSIEPRAFSEEDVAVLQALADQVAVAISNARLFEQVQESLEAERRAYGDMARQAWEGLLRAQSHLGFFSTQQGVSPLVDGWRPEMKTALRTGQTAMSEGGKTAMPIKVRGQIIGVVGGRKPGGAGEWTAEETALMQALTEQLSVALESARLYQDSQRRAARERVTGQVTARMRETLDIDAVLRTAVREMRTILNLAEAEVQLGVDPVSE
jgi:GAF domain-containing protein